MNQIIVLADALQYNKFKKCYTARVTAYEDKSGHILTGAVIEGKTKEGVFEEAEHTAIDMANDFGIDPVIDMEL